MNRWLSMFLTVFLSIWLPLAQTLAQVAPVYSPSFHSRLDSAYVTPRPHLYTGEQMDPDLGFYYLRARYHNPDSGRFWTMDSYEGDGETPLSLHAYLYSNANPVNGIDPSGNATLEEQVAVNGGLQSLITTSSAAGATAVKEVAMKKIIEGAAVTVALALAMTSSSSDPSEVNIEKDVQEKRRRFPHYKVFIHATSTGAWPGLETGGVPQINPELGYRKDFGRGFYTYDADEGPNVYWVFSVSCG